MPINRNKVEQTRGAWQWEYCVAFVGFSLHMVDGTDEECTKNRLEWHLYSGIEVCGRRLV